MITVATAIEHVLAHTAFLPATVLPVDSGLLGQVLAADVRSDLDSPPFTKSLRDGYAIRIADFQSGQRVYQVAGNVAAGSQPPECQGDAIRIMTGAIVPAAFDAVVMQEDCTRVDDQITINTNAVHDHFVFKQGAEYRQGQVVLPQGTVITPQVIGMLASLGQVSVMVYAKPHVAVLSTGSEIIDAARTPVGTQIRNSNLPMLAAQISRAGGEPTPCGICPDDPVELRQRVTQALAVADLLLVTGGVSVGDYDYLPQVLAELGAIVHFHQVAMKPGKPLLFATLYDKPIFGLPGNPVSGFTCFELFVRLAMQKMQGLHIERLPWCQLPIAAPLMHQSDRPTYLPSVLTLQQGTLTVSANSRMNSASLTSLLSAEALVMLPEGCVQLQPPSMVNTLILNRPYWVQE